MILDLAAERVVILADLRLTDDGADRLRPEALESLLADARAEGALVCVNGGLLAPGADPRSAERALAALRERADGRLHALLGRPDAELEPHLSPEVAAATGPLLNVTSGGRRIRIEPGDLYTPSTRRRDRLRSASALRDRSVAARHRAANALFTRGIQTVIFGCDPRPSSTEFTDDRRCACVGSWAEAGAYATIRDGALALWRWTPRGPRPSTPPRSDP